MYYSEAIKFIKIEELKKPTSMIHQLFFYLIYSSSCILDQESCLIYSMQKSKVSLKISSQLQNLITARSYKKIIYQIYHDPLHSF